MGFALHATGWPHARELFDEWSAGSVSVGGQNGFEGSNQYNEGDQDKLWNSCDRDYKGSRITLLTIYDKVRKLGWADPKQFYHFTDKGNGERLAERHGQNFRFVTEWNAWLVWKNNRWQVDNNFEITRLAKETIEGMYKEALALPEEARNKLREHARKTQAVSSIKAMIELAKSETGIPISASKLDADPYLLGVKNGILDLRTMAFRKALRDDYMTMHCNVYYDQKAKCPNWLKFLNRITDNNVSVIGYKQRCSGYYLTGSVSEEISVFIGEKDKTGRPRLGKLFSI